MTGPLAVLRLSCNEPTQALDLEILGEVVSVMKRPANEGMTMDIITHEMNFARRVSSHVVVFERGTVVEEGLPGQIFDWPTAARTRDFRRHLGCQG